MSQVMGASVESQVGMHQQSLEALDGERRRDGRDREAEDQEGQDHRRSREGHVNGMASIRSKPIHGLDGVVQLVEPPKCSDLMAGAMSPIARNLSNEQAFDEYEPGRLQLERRGHHGRDDEPDDWCRQCETYGQDECGEQLVDEEMHTVGGEPLSKARLSALGKSAFENDEQEPEDAQGNGRVTTDENRGHEDCASDQPEHGS